MTDHNFASMRAAMVDSQLRTNSVSDPKVVAAMESVAREAFVPADRIGLAYVDVPTPLGNGRSLNAPLMTGRLIIEARVKPTDHVLLIGAATGYAAAVLAKLAEAVVAVESDPALATFATKALETSNNVTVVQSAMTVGYEASAPYDIIMIDGAVEVVPPALWTQLKLGGVMVAAVLDKGVTRLSYGRNIGGQGALSPFAEGEVAVLSEFSTPHSFAF